jgi:hypothetical protein
MDNYIWLFQKKEDRALGWTFVCSLAFHCLLLTILVIKPVYPLSGDTEKLDIIWLYPALQPMAKTEVPVRFARTMPVAEVVRKGKPADPINFAKNEVGKKAAILPAVHHDEDAVEEVDPVEEKVEPQLEAEMVAVKIDIKKVETMPEKPPVITKPAEIKPADEAIDLKPKVVQNMKAGFDNISVARERTLVKKTEIKQAQATSAKIAEQTRITKNEVTPYNGKVVEKPMLNKQSSLFEPTPATPGRVLQAKAPSERITSQQVAAIQKPVQNAHRSVIDSTSSARKSAAERPTVNIGNNNQKAAVPGPSAQIVPGSKPLESNPDNGAKTEKTSDRQAPATSSEPRGIMIPPIMGDLKLEVTGATNLKITAVFTEYLKTRHGRPMTKAESKRVQPAPLKHNTREKKIEAVVGMAGEGVYQFIVEPADDNPVPAVFVVKIHEAGSKAKIRPLGTKTVTEKVVVTKILMPEGILWEDDSYFSGNLEDSESITKYNSDTGVIWKEYH